MSREQTAAASGAAVLVSIEEAARRLSLPRYKAYELVRSGELQSVSISPRIRKVTPGALNDYVAGCASGPRVKQTSRGGR